MPLRSVEAASRDDAIAAAREQFGPQARVVGVRRVRSGGVLGFFATERYVAEVAAEPPGRPGLPVPASAAADTDRHLTGRVDGTTPRPPTSPPPRLRRTGAGPRGRARPQRCGGLGRRGRRPDAGRRARRPDRCPHTTPAAARSAPPPGRRRRSTRPAVAPRADDERVSELAGLLTTQQPEAATPAYARTTFPRAAFPRTGSEPAPADRSSATRTTSRSRGPARPPDRARLRRAVPVHRRARADGGRGPGRPPGGQGSHWTSPQARSPAPPRHPRRPGPGPSHQQSHRCSRPRRARRRKRWEIRSSRRPLRSRTARSRCPPGRPSPRSRPRRCPPARRPSPTCCAAPSPRGTPTRPSPASSARSSRARPRRRR